MLGLLNTPFAIILPAAFNPIGVFIIRMQLKGFPKEYIEAAENCGANHFQIFRHIVFPNIKGAMSVLIIFIFTENWNIIDQAIVFNTNPFSQPLSIYLSQIANADIGLLFATSCFYLIPIFLIFILIISSYKCL